MSGFGAIYRLVVSATATRGRLLLLVSLAMIAVLVGLIIGANDPLDPTQTAADLLNGYGLAVLAPVVSLVFASAALGDMTEDDTLVYLWLRPVPRQTIALAAVAAAASLAIPIVVVPLALAALVSGGGTALALGAVAAGSVCVAAYCGLFVAAGLRLRRPLAWGLSYVLIWEGFVARAGDSAARLSVQTYGRSVLSEAADVDLSLSDIAPVAAMVVPVLVAMLGVALTTWLLQRRDVA